MIFIFLIIFTSAYGVQSSVDEFIKESKKMIQCRLGDSIGCEKLFLHHDPDAGTLENSQARDARRRATKLAYEADALGWGEMDMLFWHEQATVPLYHKGVKGGKKGKGGKKRKNIHFAVP